MNILIACESSGVVRNAFRARGHDCYSCDLFPSEDGETDYHLRMDALVAAYQGNWDMMIAHPPCTYLSNSGWHWTVRELRQGKEERIKCAEAALQFFMTLWSAPIKKIVMENPIPGPLLTQTVGKYDQKIQPYMFGDDASKQTCLWLKGVAPLVIPDSNTWVQPRIVDGKSRWSNQTNGGHNRLGPSKHRAADRARTYAGIGAAFAANWGDQSE